MSLGIPPNWAGTGTQQTEPIDIDAALAADFFALALPDFYIMRLAQDAGKKKRQHSACIGHCGWTWWARVVPGQTWYYQYVLGTLQTQGKPKFLVRCGGAPARRLARLGKGWAQWSGLSAPRVHSETATRLVRKAPRQVRKAGGQRLYHAGGGRSAGTSDEASSSTIRKNAPSLGRQAR